MRVYLSRCKHKREVMFFWTISRGASRWFQPDPLADNSYFVFCAACSTVEIDVITGEVEVCT